MNRSETTQALGLAQAFDLRTVGEADVLAWHSVLGHLEAADVMEAIRRHYADQTDRIMPAHIRRLSAVVAKEREVSPWAPGQYGVPREEPLPEVSAIAVVEVPGAVLDLITQARAFLPAGDREALFPRRVAWEREQRAYRRGRDARPNPHYRPTVDRDDLARAFCRENGPHDDGMHIETCPDAER